MARLRRFCPVGLPVHVIQRGNNRSDCFGCDNDKATYMRYLNEGSQRYSVDVHSWVLMSNHVHLLLTPRISGGVSKMLQYMGRHYVRFFNRKYQRTGTLWEGRFKSCLVQSEQYFLACQRYIELNPVRAGIAAHPVEYHWSSYHTNAFGVNSTIVRPHVTYLSLGNSRQTRQEAYRSLFDDVLPIELIDKIRFSVNKGVVLGSQGFVSQIETESGQRGRLLKTGPKGPHIR